MNKNKSFINKIYRKKSIDKIKRKVDLFGVSKKFDEYYFMKLRLLTSFIMFIFSIVMFNNGVLVAPIFTSVWYFAFGYLMLDYPLKKREEKLNREAYYYFEVLTLALESGRNLENAIKMACKYIDSEISSEFQETLKEVNFGKSLMESLKLMNRRIPSLTINNIILNMEQSSMFGNSIIETMHNQLDFLKDKQVMDIKEQINKIPNKISIVSVLIFIPLILLIILGPLLVRYIVN